MVRIKRRKLLKILSNAILPLNWGRKAEDMGELVLNEISNSRLTLFEKNAAPLDYIKGINGNCGEFLGVRGYGKERGMQLLLEMDYDELIVLDKGKINISPRGQDILVEYERRLAKMNRKSPTAPRACSV